MGVLFDGLVDKTLSKALDAASLRQQVLASNLANANTPNFKRSEVRFEEILTKVLSPPEILPLAVTHPAHITNHPGGIEGVRPEVVVVSDITGRVDGNNVDPDQEMAKLAKNSLMYGALTSMVNRRFNLLKTVITEGRR